AGIAELHNNQLYGYLTSDEKCRFSVFIGEEHAPGIAIGASTNKMFIKFIPKWYKIKEGDKVRTSGLDDIFFANIPVGVVTKVELQSSYKVAYIQTYSDIYHPKTFFLVNDAKASIAGGFDSNATRLKPFKVLRSIYSDINVSQAFMQRQSSSQGLISSIPSRIDQTQEEVIEAPLVPIEAAEVIKPKKVTKKKRKAKKKQPKKKQPKKKPTNSLDLF
ncbi:MAG TPA: rod shape-determining protein MreC, partial [Sulfurovum sp.]|nr:rod shape-determining protein MreC [Sulfurovum sp.]